MGLEILMTVVSSGCFGYSTWLFGDDPQWGSRCLNTHRLVDLWIAAKARPGRI